MRSLRLLLLLLLIAGPNTRESLGDDRPDRAGAMITAVVEAPDGSGWLRGSLDGVVFHSTRDGRERAIPTALDHVHALAFSPDGSILAIAGGVPGESGTVELRSWPQDNLAGRLDVSDDVVYDVAWLDRGKALAIAGADRIVRVWDVGTHRETAALEGHSGPVLAVTSSPDGKWLCSGGADGTIRVWEPGPWRFVRSMNNHLGPVYSLAFRPARAEGQPVTLASAGGDSTVRVWYPGIGRMLRIVRLPSPALGLAWTPDGARILTGAKDGCLRVVDGDGDTIHRARQVTGDRITALCTIRGTGKILVGTSAGSAVLESE